MQTKAKRFPAKIPLNPHLRYEKWYEEARLMPGFYVARPPPPSRAIRPRFGHPFPTHEHRLRRVAAQEAARLVLVEGLAPSEAARQTGASIQAVSNAATRCRDGLALAQQAAGITQP